MAIHLVNDVAVVRHGDLTTILFAPSREVTADLRMLLAKVNAVEVGNTSEGVRQLLHDLEAAMQKAFRWKAAPTKHHEVGNER